MYRLGWCSRHERGRVIIAANDCPRALLGHPGLFRDSTAVRLQGKENNCGASVQSVFRAGGGAAGPLWRAQERRKSTQQLPARCCVKRSPRIPAHPRPRNLWHHHPVLSSATPRGVAARRDRCRVREGREPSSGGRSENGSPPQTVRRCGRACAVHRVGANADLRGAGVARRRPSNGALEGVIYITLVSALFSAPAK
jgi:hypothetical protein